VLSKGNGKIIYFNKMQNKKFIFGKGNLRIAAGVGAGAL